MSSSDPREVIVDDNSGTIQYTGPWYLTDGKDYDNKGDSGKPYSNSLHGTFGEASLSYSFVGSSGRVMGTIDFGDDDDNSPGTPNSNWECILDGIKIPTNTLPSSTTNDFCLCQWDSVLPGSHSITLNVNNKGNTAFWFDQIIYLPTPDLVLSNATILVPDTDPALKYDSEWQSSSNGHTAVDQGAVVTFSFFGSSLSWYGAVLEPAQDPSTGFFSVDGQNPTNFTGIAKSDHHGPQSAKFNQLFFKTPPLPQETHTLTVTSLGSNGSTPLVLSYLVVDNGELPALQTVSATSSANSSLQSMSYDHGSGRHSGNGRSGGSSKDLPYIISSILGAISLILLIAFIIVFLVRRSKIRLGSVESANSPPPYTPPKDISQLSRNPISQPGADGSQPYPFSHQPMPSRSSRYNFTKRSISISTRPNSLFPTSRLSALPSKREPSLASTSRTHRPYRSRGWFGSLSRSSSGSSATLLNYSSGPPSRKSSAGSISENLPVVDARDDEMRLSYARPPESIVSFPTYAHG